MFRHLSANNNRILLSVEILDTKYNVVDRVKQIAFNANELRQISKKSKMFIKYHFDVN